MILNNSNIIIIVVYKLSLSVFLRRGFCLHHYVNTINNIKDTNLCTKSHVADDHVTIYLIYLILIDMIYHVY